ncbi:MAG: vWA domain-containing protein [Acidobacteriota bacterium]
MQIRFADRRRGWFATCGLCLAIVLFASPSAFAGAGSLVENADDDGDLTLYVNFETPPTGAQLEAAQTAWTTAGRLLCDATDGQVRLRRVVMTGGASGRERADAQVIAEDCRSRSALLGLGRLGAAMFLCADSHANAGTIFHEAGHLVFGLGDQYAEVDRVRGFNDNGPYACSIGPGFEPGTTDARNHTIMQSHEYMDCSNGGCQQVEASELSYELNHDAVSGKLNVREGDSVCPGPEATTEVAFPYIVSLGRQSDPREFDGSSFEDAAASAHLVGKARLRDSLGSFEPPELSLFWVVEEPLRDGPFVLEDRVRLIAVIDASHVGGPWGTLLELGRWLLDYSTGQWVVLDGGALRVQIDDLESGADDLDVTIDLALLQGIPFGGVDQAVDLVSNGIMPCGLEDCARRWDPESRTWATTSHSLRHDFRSDWEVLHDHFDFIEMPPGAPEAEAPEHCFEAPAFDLQLQGSDQVVLVLDRSGSMADPATGDPGSEICDNEEDDDLDGVVDERPCSESRLAFLQAAVRAWIDLQAGSGIEAGLIAFDSRPERLAEVDSLDGNVGMLRGLVDGMDAGGRTAIGDALDMAAVELGRFDDRQQSILLVSDGMNNEGADPSEVATRLRESGIQIFAVPTGAAADRETLGGLAALTGGGFAPIDDHTDLPALYAELAARFRGAAPVIARYRFAVAKDPGKPEPGAEAVVSVEKIEIPVERDAKQLSVLLGGRNGDMKTWSIDFELVSPTGEIVRPGDPRVVLDPFYRAIRVDGPTPGVWTLVVWSADGAVQRNVVTATVDHPQVGFYADAWPRLPESGSTVEITANPRVLVPLEGDGVTVTARVTRPFGDDLPIDLTVDPLTGTWKGEVVADTRGAYTVTFRAEVTEDALPIAGEPIFEGPERADVDVPTFERTATASFVVTDGPLPKCTTDDCDDDGVPNDKECKLDIDGDGWPSAFDQDSDGDDTADGVEWLLDTDGDGISDACDPMYPKSK